MRQQKLFWGSSYDRGLDILLYMWSDVLKEYPEAELHICYGWDMFDKANFHNPERMEWKAGVQKLMNQKGVIHHGRVGQDELKKIRSKCGIWAYPTYFTEINCITALEAQQEGLVPIVCNFKHDGHYTALDETVGSGVKVEGYIKEDKTREVFVKKLLELMGDKKLWRKESKKAIKFAKNYKWDKIADAWTTIFEEPITYPKVTIVTPTIKKGWWNLMSRNIAKQTYKGEIEWLVVDGYPEDRKEIAKEYADKYKLNIVYLRDKKRKVKRLYGLVNANNTAIQHATGELLVWLQDFVFMPSNGIESLVDIYRHNPDALIAPVDIYYFNKIEPDTNSEDWFNGEIDVIGDLDWKNRRVQNKGIRESDDPYDFEANYGAIPAKIVKQLNGFWEFMDDGLGHDNTEIAMRAMKLGYKLIVDDTNIATCLDHWTPLKGSPENILGRERNMNVPRYEWLVDMMKESKIPVVRDEKLDDKIRLLYTIPKDVPDEDCADWIRKHWKEVEEKWLKEVKI